VRMMSSDSALYRSTSPLSPHLLKHLMVNSWSTDLMVNLWSINP
jgi:hypothetical protein